MIKILHLITNLETGGAETMLYNLLGHMDNAQYKNIVVSLIDKGSIGNKIENLGISVFCLNMSRGMPTISGFLEFFTIIRREKPNIIQTWLYHADLLGLITAKLFRIPVIWNIRGSSRNWRKYSWLSRQVFFWCKILSSFPDGVIANSHEGKKAHEKLGYHPKWWTIIPNGINISNFCPNENIRIDFRKELGISNDIILIGHIARFHPVKGHFFFMNAAKILLEKHYEVRFVLAGREVNYHNKYFKDAIGNQSKFFFLLDEYKDISRLMVALDVSVSSSIGEGFSNAIAESMSCGIPCVATNVGDSAYIIGKTGIIVAPEDFHALSIAIEELINSGSAKRKELGITARSRIQSLFSIHQVCSIYQEVYKKIL